MKFVLVSPTQDLYRCLIERFNKGLLQQFLISLIIPTSVHQHAEKKNNKNKLLELNHRFIGLINISTGRSENVYFYMGTEKFAGLYDLQLVNLQLARQKYPENSFWGPNNRTHSSTIVELIKIFKTQKPISFLFFRNIITKRVERREFHVN